MRARILTLLACASLVAGLSACGGGDSTSSSTPSDSASSTPSHSASGAGAPSAAAKPGEAGAPAGAEAKAPGAPRSPVSIPGGSGSGGPGGSGEAGVGRHPPTRSHHASSSRHAAGAAGFLVASGDNSIPRYGSEAPAPVQAEAAAALRAYLDARAGGDWSAACSHMGASVRAQLEVVAGPSTQRATGCADAYASIFEPVSASDRASPFSGSLAAFRVKGETAFALFYGPGNQQYMMPMVSEGGAWAVNQIDPIPWPIGAAPSSP